MRRINSGIADAGTTMIQKLAADPVALIEQGAPHRIHTDAQLDLYTQTLFRLTAKKKATHAEQETIDLLTLLIEDYESKDRLPDADPVTVLKYLMAGNGLLQQDLRHELGSISNISMILSGQRSLTISNASALALRFHVDLRAFLPNLMNASNQRRTNSKRAQKISKRTNAAEAVSLKQRGVRRSEARS